MLLKTYTYSSREIISLIKDRYCTTNNFSGSCGNQSTPSGAIEKMFSKF